MMGNDPDSTGVELFGALATIAETAIGLAISKHPAARAYDHYGEVAALGALGMTEVPKAALNASDGGVGVAIGGGVGSTVGGLLGSAAVGALFVSTTAPAWGVALAAFAASALAGAASEAVGAAIGNNIDAGSGNPTEYGFEPGSGQPTIDGWDLHEAPLAPDADKGYAFPGLSYGSPVGTGGTGYVGDHPGPWQIPGVQGDRTQHESAADRASDKAAADRAVAEYNRDRQGVDSQHGASGSGPASGTTTYPTNGGGTTPTYNSGTGYVGDHPGPSKAPTKPSVPAYGGGRPILLDLNGNGAQITDLSKSTQFIDAGNDGFKHRTAWAAAGDGVLFYDADNDNTISQTREYVFTEWDPTAKSDMQALRARFDSNNDGKLMADDAAFAQFKVMVTQADDSQVAQSLTQLGITEIRLTEDATRISLADGSMIDGQSTFVMNGVTGTVASAALMAEVQGYCVRRNAVA